MKTFDLLMIGVLFISLGFGLNNRFNNIEKQNLRIINNQNQIILLLSKDYPDISIQKTKKRKIKLEKLATLEN